jgi:hypothetical protein
MQGSDECGPQSRAGSWWHVFIKELEKSRNQERLEETASEEEESGISDY